MYQQMKGRQTPPFLPGKNLAPTRQTNFFQTGPQRTFDRDNATQVAMPIGGIGAGSICLNRHGGLQDFSIRTRPENTAMPAGFTANSPEAAFAILDTKGTSSVTQRVEGPFPAFNIFDQGLPGQSCGAEVFEGFPRFAKCTLKGVPFWRSPILGR
jgi:hypothetical protein